MDLLKFCCSFCDLDFVYSDFKVKQYLRLTIAFKLVLSQSSQILLPLCNPAIPSLAVSCNPIVMMFSVVNGKTFREHEVEKIFLNQTSCSKVIAIFQFICNCYAITCNTCKVHVYSFLIVWLDKKEEI